MTAVKSHHDITYQNDSLHSYMVVSLEPEDNIIEYQVNIIKENPVKQLLALHKKQIDDKSYIFYDITSKVTLEQFLNRKKLYKHEFLSIVKSLIKGLQLGRQYLLKGGSFILHVDSIYIEPSSLELSLAYMPIQVENNLNEAIKLLITDLIVNKVAFTNSDEGNFVYRLLNLIRSDSFSIKSLDQLICSIALEREKKETGDSIQAIPQLNDSIKQKTSIKQDRTDKALHNKPVLLLQLFFIALGILLLRYFALQQGGIKVNILFGIILIIASVDFLIVNKIKPLIKTSDNTSSTKTSNNRERKLQSNKISEMNKNSKYKNNEKHGNKSVAVAQINPEHINHGLQETCILQQEKPRFAYLLNSSEGSIEKIVINKPSFVIGRLKSQVDYADKNSAVGKLHAEILITDGQYFIKDLNSKNGTYINGEKVTSNTLHAIKNNDIIAFANSEYKFLIN